MVYSRSVKHYTYIFAIAAATCLLGGCMNVSPDKQAAHTEKYLHVGEAAEDFAVVPYDTDRLQSQDINELELVLTGFADGAPEFSLMSTSGGQVRLSEELANNHVLLYFYAADFTPNSTRDLRKLGELQTELLSSNIKIYGISGKLLDGYASLSEQQAKFHGEFALPIHILADTGLEVAKAYGCTPEGGEYPQRTMVLISQRGQVLAYSRLMLTADQVREYLLAGSAAAPAEPETESAPASEDDDAGSAVNLDATAEPTAQDESS